jgi:hypothetical protein
MPLDYLHNHAEFADLIRIVATAKSIDPGLVEKDYWIMHGLYGRHRCPHRATGRNGRQDRQESYKAGAHQKPGRFFITG